MQIYTTFEKAVTNLKAGIDEFQQNPQHELMRNGVFFRFILAYEETRKMLAQYLGKYIKEPDSLNFQETIQLADEKKLLMNGWDKWKRYRKIRNEAAHKYDGEIILPAMTDVHEFYAEALHILEQMKKGK